MNKKIIATKFFNLGGFLQDEVLPELLKKFRQHNHHIVRLYIAKLVTLCDRGATWLNPNLAEAYYRLGLLFQKQQKWLEAATAFEEATKNGCLKLADAYCNLGKILLIIGQFEESLRALHQAIKLEPEKSLFYQLLGKTLSEKGELSEAIKNYQIASQKKISQTHPHVVLKSQKEQHLSTPNFLIIGQVKCGTSSLYSYLTQHPQILPAIKKEIHFWNNNFNKGINWYLAHFPSIDSEQNLITGEATPNYLESQKIPESIFQEFPNIKLIVLLRNPVDRAISQYYMFVNKGKEKHSIEKAILSEIESITRKSNIDSLNNFSISKYIKRSQYIEHLS